MLKLTKEKEELIRDSFLKHIGKVISKNRNKKDMTQTELGYLVGVDRSVISDYEHAVPHKTISTLPLISYYCDFDLSEYFYQPDLEMCMTVLDELIHILTIEPKAKPRPKTPEEEEFFPAGIFMEHIQDPKKSYVKKTAPKVVGKTYTWKKSKFKGNIYAYDPFPLSKDELRTYLSRPENSHICDLLKAAKTLLYTPKKTPTTVEKKQIAEYVIARFLDESDIDMRNRLLVYFRMHFDSYKSHNILF